MRAIRGYSLAVAGALLLIPMAVSASNPMSALLPAAPWRGEEAGRSMTLPDFGRSESIPVARGPSGTAEAHHVPAAALPVGKALAGDEYWSSDFDRRGVWGQVFAIGDDGGDLVIGGSFSFAGSVAARNIARWDGAAWRPYGDGIGTESFGEVKAITQLNGHLLVGGNFRMVGQDSIRGVNAAYWDGSAWHAMDQSDWTGWVYDFQVYHDQLYAGGTFWKAQDYTGLLVWDGSRWQSAGVPFRDGWDLLVYNDRLLAATADLYAWDGASWSQPFGELTGGGIICLAEWNGNLVAGGTLNGIRYQGNWVGMHNVAVWNGSGWQALGGGLFGWYDDNGTDLSAVTTLAVYNGTLCAGGAFELTSIGNQEVGAPFSAQWVGDHWEGIGGGTTRFVHSMVVRGSDLVVGGWMAYAGHVDIPAHTGDVDCWGLALWNGSTWRSVDPLGQGMNGAVYCLGLYNDHLIAAGDFVLAGAARVKGIAAFDGQGWSPMGGGLTYRDDLPRCVSAMVTYESDLVVGGRILKAGDVPVQNVARWNGQSWSGMGGGVPTEVKALCVYNDTLYAGRYRWIGAAWEDFFPVDGDIEAFCAWNGMLVFGGTFQHVGAVAASRVAAWDGSSFIPLGAGTSGEVMSLACFGSDLIVSGNFGVPADCVARWDGDNWQPMGGTIGAYVTSMAVVGADVIVGGGFRYANRNYVAYGDGANWFAMGSGCGGPSQWQPAVHAFALYHGSLYVGGDFTMAGGKPSLCLGKWRDPLVPVYLRQFSAERSGAAVVVRCVLGEPRAGERLEVWRELPGRDRSRVGELSGQGATSFVFTDLTPPAGEAEYWLRAVNASGGESWYGPAHLTAAAVPARLALTSVAPNPFNPRTTIRYSLPQPTHARLGLYDQRGRLVRTLVDAFFLAGEQAVEWDGRDSRGASVASGTYIVRLITEQGVRASKITLAK